LRRQGAKRFRIITALLLLASAALIHANYALAADTPAVSDPVPRIGGEDPTGFILGLAVSSSGSMVVTGSFDDTIRTWSMPDLKPLAEPIHLPAGKPVHTAAGDTNLADDIQGAVYAIALSPDAKTVIATGWTGGWDTGQPPWCFYVVDLAARQIAKTVCDLPRKVNHATFSLDGKYVAFAFKVSPTDFTGGGVSVYRTSDYSLAGIDATYKNASNWVEFDHAGRMVTSSMDGNIRIYDAADLEKGDQLRPKLQKAMPEPRQVRKLDGLAVSPDGSKIAIGYFEQQTGDPVVPPRVDVVSSADLSLLTQPDLSGVESETKDKAPALWRVAWSPDGAFLYAGGTWKKGGSYMIRRCANGGAGDHVDYAATSSRITRLATASTGQIVFVGEVPTIGFVAGDQVFLRKSGVNDFHDIGGALGVSQDGNEVEFSSAGQVAHFSLLTRVLESGPAPDSATMSHTVTGNPDLQVRLEDNGYNPTLNGQPLAGMQPNEQAVSLAYLPNGKGFLIGTLWFIRYYDATGKQLLYTRIPTAHGMAITSDNRLLVAALGDGTIRWFSMDTFDQLLALLPTSDGQRWVAWTPKGYYMASVGGDTLFGWQVNNGHDKVGDFYPVGSFDNQYLRPDIVTKSVALLDENKAIQEANIENGRNLAAPVGQQLPPVIDILTPANGTPITDALVTLHFQVRAPAGEPLAKIEARVGGYLLPLTPLPTLDASGQAVGDFQVLVPQEDGAVSLYAENRFGPSQPSSVSLKWAGTQLPPEQTRHKIYVLAIAVSSFADAAAQKVPELKYASKDAQDFANVIKNQEGKAYLAPVTTKILSDVQGNTSLKDIRAGLAWLDQQAAQKDSIGVLFLSGHGFDDKDGSYYYMPHDGRLADLKHTALPYTDLLGALTKIGGYSVLFIDTCEAATVAQHSLSTEVDGTVNRLHKQPKGIIVYASSTGNQSALESDQWQNGIFTRVVVEGLNGQARDPDLDYITSGMLAVDIKKWVKIHTGGKQTPTASMSIGVDDLMMSLLPK
jgi:WD40 repeat protein